MKNNQLKQAIRYWNNHLIMRRFVYFLCLGLTWFALIFNAVTSPQRITYSESQLETERTFENKSGDIKLLSQTYSEDTNVLLLEFETTDLTSNLQRGINATNLDWSLYTKNKSQVSTMEIIPLTNNRIDVVIKNVPKNFEALAIDIQNHTLTEKNVDIGIDKFSDRDKESISKMIKDTNQENEQSNIIQFLITTQSPELERKEIKNLSRENFTLQLLEEELEFNQEQITKLNESIIKLEEAVVQDSGTLEGLQKETQYLVGSNLEAKQKEISEIQRAMSSKQKKIETAQSNIGLVNNNIDALEKSIAAVKDGTYEFSAPITSVQEDF